MMSARQPTCWLQLLFAIFLINNTQEKITRF